MIKEYLVSKNGNEDLSKNFKVKEFACHDGTDYLRIDTDLIPILERFREYVEAPVIINSGYRTRKHNIEVGGSTNSYHLYGKAVDIAFLKNYKYLTSSEMMARFFYTLKVKGIIKYNWGVHIDTRANKYHAKNGKYGLTITTFEKINIPLYENLKRGDKNNTVGVLQFMLKQMGYNLEVDCIFGQVTETCVLHFQDVNRLKRDGIVGIKTWNAIINK